MKRRHVLVARLGAAGPAVPGMDGTAHDNRQDPCELFLIAHDGSPQVFTRFFKQKERS
jgi:hypothetical protein